MIAWNLAAATPRTDGADTPSAPRTPGAIIAFDDASFQKEVLDSDVPVLVFFWAGWCGPCRAMNPTVARLAEEMHGRIKVVRINADNATRTTAGYAVTTLPSSLVFEAGKVVGTIAGRMKKDELRQRVAASIR